MTPRGHHRATAEARHPGHRDHPRSDDPGVPEHLRRVPEAVARLDGEVRPHAGLHGHVPRLEQVQGPGHDRGRTGRVDHASTSSTRTSSAAASSASSTTSSRRSSRGWRPRPRSTGSSWRSRSTRPATTTATSNSGSSPCSRGSQSPYLCFTLDLGVFVKRLPRVITERFLRDGMKKELVEYVAEAYRERRACA